MNVASTTIYFDTFNPTTWEAEDYDYSSGLFIDNPFHLGAAAAATSAWIHPGLITTTPAPLTITGA
jgi:hypothetical protein